MRWIAVLALLVSFLATPVLADHVIRDAGVPIFTFSSDGTDLYVTSGQGDRYFVQTPGKYFFDGTVDMGANALDCDSNTTTLNIVAGAINAGAATSLEIPNSNACATAAEGQMCMDTDDKIFRFFVGGLETTFDLTLDAAGYVLKSDGARTLTMQDDIGALVLSDLTDVDSATQTDGFVIGSTGGNYLGRYLSRIFTADGSHTLAVTDDGTDITVTGSGGDIILTPADQIILDPATNVQINSYDNSQTTKIYGDNTFSYYDSTVMDNYFRITTDQAVSGFGFKTNRTTPDVGYLGFFNDTAQRGTFIWSGSGLFLQQAAGLPLFLGWSNQAGENIHLGFDAATDGDNSYVYFYGKESGVAKRYARMRVTTTGEFEIEAESGQSIDIISPTDIGDGTNVTSFAADGTQTMAGTARVTKKRGFPLDGVGKGATAPTLTRDTNTYGYAFTIGDDGYVNLELLPELDLTDYGISVGLHVYTDDTFTPGNTRIRFTATWSAVPHGGGESIAAATHTGTLDSGDIDLSETAKGLLEIDLGEITEGNLTAADDVFVLITRSALLGAGANPANEPVVVHAEYEFVSNKLGEDM